MGQISKTLGQGSSFVFKDKTYTLSPWTYAIQGLLERHLEAEAARAIQRLPFSPDERREQLRLLSQDIVAGVYSFGSETVARALTAIPNLKYLLLLQLKGAHPDATPELVGEMVDEQLEEVYEKMAEANADPTKAAPTPEQTTTPSTPTSSAA